MQLAATGSVERLGFSPLVVGIVPGTFYAYTLREQLAVEWTTGSIFPPGGYCAWRSCSTVFAFFFCSAE